MNALPMTRRQALGIGAAAIATLACGADHASGGDAQVQEGRLSQRPRPPRERLPPGRHALELDRRRDGIIVVPDADAERPLLVMLHGAGGRAAGVANVFGPAESLGVVVVAPDSRGTTWDVIRGEFGADIAFIDRALGLAFDRCNIDRRRIAIGGFSDGASYALSVGLRNGDLFTHIIAFSPGFVVPGPRLGEPPVFISHGVDDTILPIARTSRVIVPRLQREGYRVEYDEFDGPHTVPADIQDRALRWFVGHTEGSAAS